MHSRASQAAFIIVVMVLLAGLLAGCGGGGESQGGSQEDGGSQQQGGDGGGSEQQNGDSGGSEGDEESQQVKIALGTIGSVTPDKNRFTLEPSTEEQGEKPIPFKVRKSTQITVAGEQAEIGALEEGAQANVNYITIDGKNRARSVEVIGGG